jgi:outer membrane protein assembly factor BamE (lipoprotein component of BamABCDE complex)
MARYDDCTTSRSRGCGKRLPRPFNAVLGNLLKNEVEVMKRILFYYSVTLIMLTLISCSVSVGRQFNYTNRSQLLTGTTTKDEAHQLLGEPSEKKFSSNKDGNFETWYYKYIHGSPRPVNLRGLMLEFRNGLLNGYSYMSSYADDSTDFNDENSSKIKIGVSSQHDVDIIMGTPSGKFLCPSAYIEKCKSGVEAWTWQYINSSTMKIKTAKITFSESKIVSDVTFNVVVGPTN